jgi:hypothetical protein
VSYDIRFTVGGETVELDEPHQLRGGTYAVGGTYQAELNITYNYGRFYREAFGERGIRELYGLTAAQVSPLLATAVKELGTERAADYWAATRGNAGAALADLLALARLCPPDAVLGGD